jgi:hypothetical protein
MTFRTKRSSFAKRRANSGIPGYDNQGWDAFGHPASYAQPEVDEYGIDSDFGEGVRKGPYLSGPPPASVGWMPDHPAVDQDLVEDYETGSQLHELNLKQAMERKASKCIRLAEQKLGRKASARAIENLALSYMNLPNSAIQRKLASSFMAEDVVQEGTGYYGEVDAEDMMSEDFDLMSEDLESDEMDMLADEFEDDMSLEDGMSMADEFDMMADMDIMARRANRSRYAKKSDSAEEIAEEAVSTAEQLAEEVENLAEEIKALKKANAQLRMAKKSEDAESIAEEAVETAEELAEEVKALKKANAQLRMAKKSDEAEDLAEEAVETAEQLAEEVETLSEEVETLSEEIKALKKANAKLRMAKKSEDDDELSDSEVLEEEIKALKKANARLRSRLAGTEVQDALEQNYAISGEQPVERYASAKKKAGVGRLANVLSDYMAEEGVGDDGAESLADLLAEIEAEEAMSQQASKFASKRSNKKAGQNDPRYFYQEEIEAREGKQSTKKAMFMADEDEVMMAEEEEEDLMADEMEMMSDEFESDEFESDEVDPFGLNADEEIGEEADPRLASLFFASEEDADEEEETTASKKASRFAKAKKSEEESEEEEEESEEEESEEEEEKPAKKAPAKKEAPKKEAPAKEEGKASSKKASITPRPKTQQASVKTLGNISRTASDANELSKLWQSAPDVSKFFC